MKPVSRETLQRINTEFPTFIWKNAELEELVNPQLGIITAFAEILNDIEQLRTIDLQDIGMD